MSARFRPFALLLLAAAGGCSLICNFSGLKQVCDADGDCLSGYACVGGECLVGGDGGNGSGSTGGTGGQTGGCTGDATCLAGACVDGACNDLPMAWLDGGAKAASLLSCYPWPPLPAAGLAPVPMSGCIVSFPGDSLAGDFTDGGATIEVYEDSILFPPPTPVVAEPRCASGFGYSVSVPPGQLVNVVVAGPNWATTYDQSLELPADADAGVRNLGVLSANGWSHQLTAVAKAAGLTPVDSDDALEVGIARDCNGNVMSGITIDASPLPDGGVIDFVYLDATGAPIAGRTATDSSGLFAAVALPGTYPLIFTASTGTGAPETLASLSVVISAAGSGWIDLAPLGP
jgi:hypothetical protein